VAVATTFPVAPALGGGQVRALNLYRGLSRVFDVELVTLGSAGTPQSHRELGPGLWEHRVPKSLAHAERESALEREAGTVVTDVAMPELYRHTPEFLTALRDATEGAHAAVACHPYTFPALRDVTDIPIWYEAQDVEASLKCNVLGDNEAARHLLAAAERVERDCCRDAEFVWACSEEDAQEFVQRYGCAPDRVLVVPNGVAIDEVDYVPMSIRRAHQRRLRLKPELLAVFIASWHEPNVAGARTLLQVAEELPEVDFLIVGSVGFALGADPLPRNVSLMGTVSAGLKQTILSVADVALNPVTTGSGTNLKMLEYFAAGIPVISTRFGARGLGVRAGFHYLVAEPAEFVGALASFGGLDSAELDGLGSAARSHVETRLSWTVIVEALLAHIAPTVQISGSG
jgi:glycosyltransferase involved in cell wall biosynthesis